MVVGDISKRNAKLYPGRVGLSFEGKDFTFRVFNDRVNRLANVFLQLGLNKGDRVGILEHSCPEYIELYYATAKSGTVIVPINSRLSRDEVVFILRDCGAKTLILGGDFIEMIRSTRQDLESLQHILLLGEEKIEGFESFSRLTSDAPEIEPNVDVEESDLAMIMYTSGVTGRPKGVMTTHKNMMANTVNQTLELDIRYGDITLLVMPLYHNGGLWPHLTHFYRGGKVILLRRFDEQTCLEIIEKEKVTLFNVVPVMIMRLLDYPGLDNYNIDSLRSIFCAGSPTPAPVMRKSLEFFGKRIMTGLGMTEASGGILFHQREDLYLGVTDDKKELLTSVGKDAINVETRIVNEQGEDVKPGEVGEIIAKGDNITVGYWNLPDDTAKTYRNGWLYSGDLVTKDEDGYVYVVDRAKDIIISGGENISSKEVEDVIYSCPGVLEATVIGIPDEKWGEAVHAVVVPKRGTILKEEDIVEHCKKRLASYKKPKSVEFVDALPRNFFGKVEKNRLKDKFWKGYEKRVH